MKKVTPAMLNKEAQKILTKADPYINRMAELGRQPSAVSRQSLCKRLFEGRESD